MVNVRMIRTSMYTLFITIVMFLGTNLFLLPSLSYAQGTNTAGSTTAWASTAWATTAGAAASAPCPKWDIELNTNFPFLGRCISKDVTGQGTNVGNAFPYLMGVLIRVVMTIILVAGVLLIIAGGLMMTAEWYAGTAATGKGLIIKVVVGLLLLGTSAIVLNLINPNFFGTSSQ